MPQEQASVGLAFSVAALEQSQCWAGILPQEQVASIAQTQELDFLQQVEAAILVDVGVGGLVGWVGCVCVCLCSWMLMLIMI